jgi:hypothetical protein
MLGLGQKLVDGLAAGAGAARLAGGVHNQVMGLLEVLLAADFAGGGHHDLLELFVGYLEANLGAARC